MRFRGLRTGAASFFLRIVFGEALLPFPPHGFQRRRPWVGRSMAGIAGFRDTGPRIASRLWGTPAAADREGEEGARGEEAQRSGKS